MTLKTKSLILIFLATFQFFIYPLPGQAVRNDRQSESTFLCESSKLISEAGKLNQNSREERFYAVTSLLREHSLEPTIENFAVTNRKGQLIQGKNIVLSMGSGNRTFVVGAHYDSALLEDGSVGPGMIDNAAGVIVLIHAAEAFRSLDLDCQIQFVLFDGEEEGLLGSRHFVKSKGAGKIQTMINIDVVGYGDTILFGPVKGNQRVRWGQTIRRVCVSLDLDAVAFPNYPAGDNLSFESAGIPSISIGVLPSLEAHRVWVYMNDPQSPFRGDFIPSILKVIHTKNDTVDKLQGRALISARDVILGVLRELTGPIQ